MTTTARPGPHPDPARRLPTSGPVCVACDFVETSVRRRIFFTLVDGLGEFWFVRAMQAGGFCPRHARWTVRAGGGAAMTAAYLDVIDGWLAGLPGPPGLAGPSGLAGPAGGTVRAPRVGHACYVCETEAWAEGFAIDLLARGDPAYAAAQLGGLEPLCLRHLEPLIGRVAWHRVPELGLDVASRRDEAAELGSERPGRAIGVVAGRDPNEAIRAPAPPGEHQSTIVPPVHEPSRAWANGALSMAGLQAELDAGRCPPCTAAAAAAANDLRWLADPEASPERYRDRDALCAEHLHDAAAFAPLAAERGLASALERWHWTADILANMEAPPDPRLTDRLRTSRQAWLEAWRSSRRGWLGRAGAAARAVAGHVARPAHGVDLVRRAARQHRNRPCVACEAMVTASTRTLELVAALLSGPAGVRSYEETRGLCLRHVELSGRRLEPGARNVVLQVATTRARHVRWDLQEAIRKSSWSVRYEPAGPEGSAWQRALVFVLGEDMAGSELLTTEPEQPRWSA